MPAKLNEFKRSYAAELKMYNETFLRVMSSRIKLIDSIVKYIVKSKGKKLRPLLVIMSAKLVGEPNENTYLVASIVELLHTASLVHDDVIDDSHIRRGFPSINAIWKNKIAVLMGDYMLSKCLISATETGKLETMQILAEASKRLSRGELNQIEKSRKLDVDEDTYFEIISDKTAALIGAATELGALTTSDNGDDHNNLRLYGENLGIAFQIKDDLLDYLGSQVIIGKPVGNDFKEKKLTLPLIYAFQQAEKEEIKKIKRRLKTGVNRRQVNHIIDFVKDYGGIEYALNKLEDYSLKAKESLQQYADGDVKTSLINFVDYAAQRSK